MEIKSGKGYCQVSLKVQKGPRGLPLIVYNLDENRNPIIDENSVLLLGFIEYNPETDMASVYIHGKKSQWVRGEVLLKAYDSNKSCLSEENYKKLQSVLENMPNFKSKKNHQLEARL